MSGPVIAARQVDGLAPAIDAVADRAADPQRFLRRAWYAAAVAAYGGRARTIVVEQADAPVLALPLVPLGPAPFRLAQVSGHYWPFRSAPIARDSSGTAAAAALAAIARRWRGVRLGPVPDGDPAATALVAAARAGGWTVLDRVVGQGWTQDLTDPAWPRASALKKNRFHEKHLAAHGTLDWRFLSGADWPAAFDLLAQVERASWHAGSADAKFAGGPHARFWRAAAADPALAAHCRAALLTVDGMPAAFSFDLDTGTTRHAIANSYDPRFAKHSPGKLLHYRNLRDARSRGITTVEWGSGDSGYKQVLGATPGAPIRDWLLLRPGPIAWAARPLQTRT